MKAIQYDNENNVIKIANISVIDVDRAKHTPDGKFYLQGESGYWMLAEGKHEVTTGEGGDDEDIA